MLNDLLQDILEGVLYHSLFDRKARNNKTLNKVRAKITSSEKAACHLLYLSSGTCYLILLVIIPLFFWLQGSQLLEFWACGFALHFIFTELMIRLARAVKKSPQQHSLRELLFILHRIRPFWMHVARWLPLALSLSILIYLILFHTS